MLVWHRQNWSVLRPLVDSTEDELAELSGEGVYVAGVLDRSLATREDLFDVFADGILREGEGSANESSQLMDGFHSLYF